MTHKPTSANKRVLLAAIRRGELTPAEVARALDVTHATVCNWVNRAKIDVKSARAAYANRKVYALLIGKFETKADKRERAREAMADWGIDDGLE